MEKIFVKSVRRIRCAPTPVYDATGPLNHNYALANGVVVHNTCEMARDATFQEVLPLKGKPLNVMKDAKNKALESDEVMNILMCVGYNPANKNPYDNLRVGKVILLADADDDGFHINLLVLAIFQRFLPKMFERGMVYVAKGPEYIICTPTKNYTAGSLDELRKKVPKPALMKQVIHLKGWGEVSSQALEDIAFNAKTRKLWRIKSLTKEQLKEYQALVGEDTAYRKKLLGVE